MIILFKLQKSNYSLEILDLSFHLLTFIHIHNLLRLHKNSELQTIEWKTPIKTML